MSLISGVEAALVAKQIMQFVHELRNKTTNQETIDALTEVYEKAVTIKDAGESGFY